MFPKKIWYRWSSYAWIALYRHCAVVDCLNERMYGCYVKAHSNTIQYAAKCESLRSLFRLAYTFHNQAYIHLKSLYRSTCNLKRKLGEPRSSQTSTFRGNIHEVEEVAWSYIRISWGSAITAKHFRTSQKPTRTRLWNVEACHPRV